MTKSTNPIDMTLAEAMAMHVLRGDFASACALADMLIERRDTSNEKIDQAIREFRSVSDWANDGYAVYRWPEFREFCRRAGIRWDLDTIEMTIRIARGEMMVVDHKYRARDDGGTQVPINTTTLRNETLETYHQPIRSRDITTHSEEV